MLTLFLAMDCSVELYKGGIVPLREYAERPYDRDIVVRLLVRKEAADYCYQSVRNSQTDIPVPLPGCRMAATGLRWVPARSRLCCMKNRQLRRSSWPKPSNNRWSPVPTCAAAPNTAAT